MRRLPSPLRLPCSIPSSEISEVGTQARSIGTLPFRLKPFIRLVASATAEPCAVLLGEEDNAIFRQARKELAEGNGSIVPAYLTGTSLPHSESVLEEQSRSTNTTAAGGNASLMTLG